MSLTTKLKINWLTKRKQKLRAKVDKAFAIVKRELVEYLRSIDKPDILQKYIAQSLQTDDVITFIQLMMDVVNQAKQCKGDPLAKVAIKLCNYVIFRIHYLSNFTLIWTTVKVKCSKCKHVNVTNFLYTNKLCEACGNIIL